MAAYCEGATTDLAAEALAIDLRAVRETDMAATGVCDAWGVETEADRQGTRRIELDSEGRDAC